VSYWKRVWSDLTGRARRRIPDQLALLGAPPEVVEQMRRLPAEPQEEGFIKFVVGGGQGCLLDWKAKRDDVVDGLALLLSDAERRLLPERERCPDDAAGTLAVLNEALAPAGRALVRVESLGDFSILILVPSERLQAFLKITGPWRVQERRA